MASFFVTFGVGLLMLPMPAQAALRSGADDVDWDSVCVDFQAQTASVGVDEKSKLASACLAYLRGYQTGIHSMASEGSEPNTISSICDRSVKSTAATGNTTWLERHLQANKYSEVQKLKIIQSCAYYHDGYKSGLKYARELLSK